MGIHQTKIGLESLKGVNWKNKKVLDVGCGSGKLTYKLFKKTKCSKVIGIDISKDKIKKANELFKKEKSLKVNRKPIPSGSVGFLGPCFFQSMCSRWNATSEHTGGKSRFYVADSSNLKRFKDDSFDAIFCNIAFQQFENKEKSLQEMFRVLKKGGEIRINYIEEKSELLQMLLSILIKFNLRSKEIDKIKISKVNFKKIAQKSGFSKIELKSKIDVAYFKSIGKMLEEYEGTINSKMGKFPKDIQSQIKSLLVKRLKSMKESKCVPDKWKIILGKLVK